MTGGSTRRGWRGRPPRELACVAALAALWLACFALHVGLARHERLAWAPLYVTPAVSTDALPHFQSFWSETPPSDAGLRAGDALIAAGEQALNGRSRLGVLAATHAAAEDGATRFRVLRDGAQQDAVLALRSFASPWPTLLLTVGMALGALVIWSRRPDSGAARAAALAMHTAILHCEIFVPAGGTRTLLGFWMLIGTGALFGPLTLRAIALLPEDPTPSRVARALPWSFLAIGPLLASWLIGTPLPGKVGLALLLATYAALIACLLFALARTYRRSEAPVRRQLRWVVLGLYLGLAPAGVTALIAAWQPAWRPIYEASLLTTLAIPVCMAVALTRHHLFDIDRLISATAAYSLLLILFLAMVLVPVPVAADVMSHWTGIDDGVVQASLALLLSTGVILGERAMRPRLERMFFRERYALEGGARDLRVALAGAEGPAALFELLGERLADLLGLRSCIVYVRAGDRLAPIWARAPLVPPGFDARGRLAALLTEAAHPLDETRWQRWAARALLDELEQAELESVDAKLLVPVMGEKGLVGLLCLGEKGSEDIYTPVDLALLDGIADRASAELQRFDNAAIERAERERYEHLAGYVPAPVRDELMARQIENEPGEREVSVLFVDLRGYTSFAIGRSADEIFRLLDAYTRTVSRIVREHQGFVVDFQGDGLMAVFGAPRELAHKERSAVAAALEIVDTIERQQVPDLAASELRLGVGVATGPAYVGTVQSIDRKIWCVIGNTTNLAARLQAMTKDLGVSILIDDATRRAAGALAAGFSERELRVRGRAERVRAHLAPGPLARVRGGRLS